MVYTKDDALQFIQENDVKFIKLFFTDAFGSIKSLSIQPSELERAFDTGICFDATAIGWELGGGKNDLFIVPDPATLCVLPWRPQTGRVVRFFCNVRHIDGSDFTSDPRYLLKKLSDDAFKKGYEIRVGTGCEFYLFKLDEKGRPTTEPLDDAGYCDLAPRDRGENVRREICLTLEQMGVHPESSRHEAGPGQNEVDFHYADALDSADNLSTCKTVVKTVADRYGLDANFGPAPLGPSCPGSGLHINISILKEGKNLFAGQKLSDEATHFMAGVLEHLADITCFLNPQEESFYRLERNGWKRVRNGNPSWPVTWAHENRRHIIRVPAADDLHARFEVRSPDPSCNQYLALYLILAAGFDGLEKKTPLSSPMDIPLPTRGHVDGESVPADLEYLPLNLQEAKEKACQSDFVQKLLPEEILKAYKICRNQNKD